MKVRTFTGPMVMVVAALALFTVLSMTHTAQAQPAQTVTLKWADPLPVTHYVVNTLAKPWMDRVTQLSKTKVVFQYYPSEQLGKINDMPTLLRTGVADIVYMTPSVLTGDFPLNSLFGIPGSYDSSAKGTAAYRKVLQEGPLRDEFTKLDARPILAWVFPVMDLIIAKKAVLKPEDGKGLKIRTQGGFQDSVVQALGGVPVTVTPADAYVALQRGTVDAFITQYISGLSYKWYELVKYGTFGAALGGAGGIYSINERRWQGLPPDVREAMAQAADEILAAHAKYNDDENRKAADEFIKRGVQVSQVDAAVWQKAFRPVADEWVKRMEAKGLPGKQVLDAYHNVYK